MAAEHYNHSACLGDSQYKIKLYVSYAFCNVYIYIIKGILSQFMLIVNYIFTNTYMYTHTYTHNYIYIHIYTTYIY